MYKIGIGVLLGLQLTFLVAATATRVFTFSDGSILTAAQLNNEFDNIISTLNNIDEDNISTSAAILPGNIDSTIAGTGVTVDGSGVLSVVTPLDTTSSGPIGSAVASSPYTSSPTGSTSEYTIGSAELVVSGDSTVHISTGTTFSGSAVVFYSLCDIIMPATLTMSIEEDGTDIYTRILGGYGNADMTLEIPTVNLFLDRSAGTYEYTLKMTHSSSATQCHYFNYKLIVQEL